MLESAIQDTWTSLLLFCVPTILCFLLTFIGIFYTLFLNRQERSEKGFKFFLLIFSALVLTYCIAEIVLFNYDIQHENFTASYVEFEYDEAWRWENSDTFVFFNDFNLYVRSHADLGIEEGAHTGYILYCKNSRWVLAYSKTPFEWLAPDTP